MFVNLKICGCCDGECMGSVKYCDGVCMGSVMCCDGAVAGWWFDDCVSAKFSFSSFRRSSVLLISSAGDDDDVVVDEGNDDDDDGWNSLMWLYTLFLCKKL